jgi:hypothetical protein
MEAQRELSGIGSAAGAKALAPAAAGSGAKAPGAKPEYLFLSDAEFDKADQIIEQALKQAE